MRPTLPLLLVLASLLAACGNDGPQRPAPPPTPLPADLSPTTGASDIPRNAPPSVSFRQITIAYRAFKEVPNPRSREDAFAFAKSLIERLNAGEPMESLLKYSDEKDEKGDLLNSGSVSLARSSPALPAIKKAAFTTPIGKVAQEPIDVGYGFVVLRRDA